MNDKNEFSGSSGARRATLLTVVILLVGVFLVGGFFFLPSSNDDNQAFLMLEDDTNIESEISSDVVGDNLIIDYQTNEEQVWIEGLPESRYEIADGEITIFDYSEDDFFRLHIGEESDIYEFGNEAIITLLKDTDEQETLRDTDVVRELEESSNKYKSYDSAKRKLLIEDSNYESLIDIELVSGYSNEVSAGPDTLVAEFNLVDWKDGAELLDIINTYDIKNNFERVDKNFNLKYAIDSTVEECNSLDEYNENYTDATFCRDVTETEWISFTSMAELPNKNIRIGLFTETIYGENIEWVPIIEGFTVAEWADWTVTSHTSYEWQTDNGDDATVIQMNATHYIVVYSGSGEDGYAELLAVAADGHTISHIDTHEFDNVDVWDVAIAQATETKYLITYQGLDGDGYAVVLNVAEDGTLSTPGANLEWEETNAEQNYLINVSATKFINTYHDSSSDGRAIVLDVSSNTVSVPGTSHEYYTGTMYGNYMVAINSSNYLVSYWDGDNQNGYAKVIFLASDGDTLSSPGSHYQFTGNTERSTIAQMNLSNYVVAYNSDNDEVYVTSLAIAADGHTISETTADTVIWTDTTGRPAAEIVKINKLNYLVTHCNYTGWATAVTLNDAASTITVEDEHQFYSGYYQGASIVRMNDTNYFTIWEDGSGDGRAEVISVSYPFSGAITYPTNGATYTDGPITHFNWSITNSTPTGACQYSLNGAANVSVTCGDSYEAIAPGEGAHTLILSLNDTYGVEDSDTIAFTQNIPLPVVSLSYPVNGSNYSTNINHFNWSITNGTTLTTCEYSLDGAANVSVTCGDNYKTITPGDGSHNIIMSVEDDLSRTNWTQNYFFQDATGPVLNVTYPFGTFTNMTVPHTLYFNWTASDATSNLSSCWYVYNNTNTTVTCGDQNTTFMTNLAGDRSLTFWSNDSLNNIASTVGTWDYKMLEYNRIFDTTSYETTSDTYILNMSSDGTETVTAEFWYNNTNYTATKTGNNVDMIFTSDITHPWGTTGNLSFYWTVNHGADKINTTIDGQTIAPISFGACNDTLTQPFLNFTFKSEGTGLFINSTFEAYDWLYWIGDGSQNKSFSYVNTTEQESYAFCASPNLTFGNNASVVYDGIGYPQRTYAQVENLTSTTTYVVLQLLSTADGQYVTFQVQDTNAKRLDGALIFIEKLTAGSFVFLGQDLTDSAGTKTFFLNPDDSHRITISKAGYTTYTSTINPTNSIYTIVMSGGAIYETYYTFDGISVNTYPQGGTILAPSTTYTFGMNVTSFVGNITACKLEMLNGSFSSIGSSVGCTAYGGNITLDLGTGTHSNFIGNYYINFGSGYELFSTSNWVIDTVNISTGGAYGFELMYKFNNYTGFGEAGNQADYNRITFFFILLVLGLGLFTRYTGLEFTSPGYTLILLSGIVVLFSIPGMFDINSTVGNTWLTKYYVSIVVSMLAGGYLAGYWRRNTT